MDMSFLVILLQAYLAWNARCRLFNIFFIFHNSNSNEINRVPLRRMLSWFIYFFSTELSVLKI